MNTRTLFVSALAASLIVLSGCAVTRGQESVGSYIDDTAITSSVKARFVANNEVDASSIKVDTLNGTVLLSGFAKNGTERTTAESLAREVKGVKSIQNKITVRP